MLKNLTLVALMFLPGTPFARADAPARCYLFSTANTPAMEHKPSARTERWCYQKLSNPVESLYIYNGDGAVVRPELAALKENSGVLIHGSLLAGKVTMHSVKLGTYNPLPIPLDEPANRSSEVPPLTSEFTNSAKATLEQLIRARGAAPAILAVTDGSFTAEATIKPWRGYWWPNKGTPLVGPFAKYEGYVAARTGSSPGTVNWEKTNHIDHGYWWEGHCNGWAASSIMRAEPAAISVDQQSSQSFSVSEQKGLLAEDDYCANTVMFGDRFDGTGTNPNPVTPDAFHKTLAYYIGSLSKPVAMNYRPDDVVDNHVISGYKFDIQKSGPNAFTVTATLKMHRYDATRIEAPGIAPTYSRIYHYSLTTDPAGNPIGGQWLGGNPGFLWVPLSSGRCEYGNPNLDEDFVMAITNQVSESRH